jgi:hypothetical protein
MTSDPITPLSKGFSTSWSCAFFFPSIICQHHLNRLTKLFKHNNTNQQPNPLHQSTCLPTSDPAAPTRPVTRYDQPTHERYDQTQLTNTPQRTVSDAEIKAQQEANRFHEGKENSHKANDSSTFTCDAPSITPETRC